MDNINTSKPQKKRGPTPKENMVDTHLFVPADLLIWAKAQEEGFASLVRALLRTERQRRREQP